MRLFSKIAVLGLVALVTCAVGCDKTVEMRFENATSQDLDVYLDSTRSKTIYMDERVGTAAADHGNTVSVKLKFKKDDLPATVVFRAEGTPMKKSFTITDDTPDWLRVVFAPGGKIIGPFDKGTKVDFEHKSTKTRKIGEEEFIVD